MMDIHAVEQTRTVSFRAIEKSCRALGQGPDGLQMTALLGGDVYGKAYAVLLTNSSPISAHG
jgi:hypothetical protein